MCDVRLNETGPGKWMGNCLISFSTASHGLCTSVDQLRPWNRRHSLRWHSLNRLCSKTERLANVRRLGLLAVDVILRRKTGRQKKINNKTDGCVTNSLTVREQDTQFKKIIIVMSSRTLQLYIYKYNIHEFVHILILKVLKVLVWSAR